MPSSSGMFLGHPRGRQERHVLGGPEQGRCVGYSKRNEESEHMCFLPGLQEEVPSQTHTNVRTTTPKWLCTARQSLGRYWGWPGFYKISSILPITLKRKMNKQNPQTSHQRVSGLISEGNTDTGTPPSTAFPPHLFCHSLFSCSLILSLSGSRFFPEVSTCLKNAAGYLPASAKPSKLSVYQPAFQIPPPSQIIPEVITRECAPWLSPKCREINYCFSVFQSHMPGEKHNCAVRSDFLRMPVIILNSTVMCKLYEKNLISLCTTHRNYAIRVSQKPVKL